MYPADDQSTSILTLVTAISRVLISFLPLGSIAAFRASRLSSLVQDPDRKPVVGEEAQEFYLMWCQGEKPRIMSQAESYQVLEATPEPDGSILLPGGRKALPIPKVARGPFESKRYGFKSLDPSEIRNDPRFAGRVDHQAKLQRRLRFLLPPLPEASLRYYEALPAATRSEVDQLRRYWAFIRLFKDRLRMGRVILFFVFILPGILLGGAYIAAIEQVPLTGRWRLILLTPEEEDTISDSLAGVNWYKSVLSLLTTAEAPAPRVVPHSDWRYQWVSNTLRKLEAGIVALDPDDPATQRNSSPTVIQPPPSAYPLRPRPRASARLHEALPGGHPNSGREHLDLGPPYSLMVMQKDEANAFSYGFGGRGAGGIVVYTGLLDAILKQNNEGRNDPGPVTAVPPSKGFLSGLFGSPAAPTPAKTTGPTEQQTLHLASVLAHEMGHLLLSHHLETLSQQHVLWPSLLGLSMDLFRAVIWPVT